MRKKNSDIKVHVFIREIQTNKLLAGQREAILNHSAEESDWKVYANSLFVESQEAYKSLATSFSEEESVNVHLEFLSGEKHQDSYTITRFNSDMPYADLEQYSLSLKSHNPLSLHESNKLFSLNN